MLVYETQESAVDVAIMTIMTLIKHEDQLGNQTIITGFPEHMQKSKT